MSTRNHDLDRTLANHDTSLSGFPAVIDERTHTLILGSFPGEASLNAQQYYAFRHNQFWRLLSALLEIDLVTLDYPEKLAILLTNGIGLWDVFKACERKGSLDSAIRAGQLNDFAALQHQYPRLKRVCFNGKTAARIQAHFQSQGYETLALPSSSPANAMQTFEQKLCAWQQIIPPFETIIKPALPSPN